MLENNKVLIVAEVGCNHDGDIVLAKKLIDEVALTGADAIKFLSYRTETLISRNYPVFPRAKSLGFKTQFERFKQLEFSFEQLIELSVYARDKKLLFIVSPFDLEYVEKLSPYVDAYKIASGELINLPLLEKVGFMDKFIMLSTGQANLEEITRALNCLNKNEICLLYCVSSYPTPDDDVNINSVKCLKEKFDVHIGYSDHTIGILACLASVVLGAKVIEKHYTYDKTKPYGDHLLSADLEEMTELVSNIRRLEKMIGVNEKKCRDSEQVSKNQLRRKLCAAMDLEKDTILEPAMLMPLMSVEGISVSEYAAVCGKILNSSKRIGEPICFDDLKK